MRNEWSDGHFEFQSSTNFMILMHPCIITKAAEATAARRLDPDAGIWRESIDVRWVSNDGLTICEFKMRPYTHPSGAADITIGVNTTDATTGNVTYAPSVEGKSIGIDGVLSGNEETSQAVAGFLLADYYYSQPDDAIDVHQNGRALLIEEGDFLYLVEEGEYEAYVDSAANANDMLVTKNAGNLTAAGAINTAGTIAQYHATLIKNQTGWSNPLNTGVAQIRDTIGAAELAWVRLLLPPRYV